MEETKIVETETTVVDETITTPTDEKVEPKIEETKVETEKKFTQAEVDKFVESRVYKERDSIAKKLGIGDKYSKDALENFIKSTSEVKSELEIQQQKYDELVSEKNKIQEEYLVNKFNVDSSNASNISDFMTLVNSNLTADKTLEQSASEVAERLQGSNMFISQAPTKVVIGTDKSSVDTTLTQQQTTIEALRKL